MQKNLEKIREKKQTAIRDAGRCEGQIAVLTVDDTDDASSVPRRGHRNTLPRHQQTLRGAGGGSRVRGVIRPDAAQGAPAPEVFGQRGEENDICSCCGNRKNTGNAWRVLRRRTSACLFSRKELEAERRVRATVRP